jgi:hypothetical protein
VTHWSTHKPPAPRYLPQACLAESTAAAEWCTVKICFCATGRSLLPSRPRAARAAEATQPTRATPQQATVPRAPVPAPAPPRVAAQGQARAVALAPAQVAVRSPGRAPAPDPAPVRARGPPQTRDHTTHQSEMPARTGPKMLRAAPRPMARTEERVRRMRLAATPKDSATARARTAEARCSRMRAPPRCGAASRLHRVVRTRSSTRAPARLPARSAATAIVAARPSSAPTPARGQTASPSAHRRLRGTKRLPIASGPETALAPIGYDGGGGFALRLPSCAPANPDVVIAAGSIWHNRGSQRRATDERKDP